MYKITEMMGGSSVSPFSKAQLYPQGQKHHLPVLAEPQSQHLPQDLLG